MGEILSENCVFLDFDGVLFNTVKEAYVITSIAMKKYQCIDDVVFDTDHFKCFLKYRYLVGPAWNYKYMWELLSIDGLREYEQIYQYLISRAKYSDYHKFENLFFFTRDKIKLNEFDKWINLNEPYDFLKLVKHHIIKNDKLFIITTKDKATVKDLLELEGIDMNGNSIYDKVDFDRYKSKFNIINSIIKNRNIDKAIFIDDSAEHLKKCGEIKRLSIYQAGWGYISPKDASSLSMSTIAAEINNLLGRV
ncbi:MAG: HAD family hydrolase [Candidatus Sedimenticola sp. (ex Thyasira tokunagai)]